jgi:hypothetical protein
MPGLGKLSYPANPVHQRNGQRDDLGAERQVHQQLAQRRREKFKQHPEIRLREIHGTIRYGTTVATGRLIEPARDPFI